MQQTYEQKLLEIAEKDPRIVVMTAENRAAIRGLPDKMPDRFIDTGITEQTMIGMAAGLALRGRVPVAHALSTFLTLRAFEFIRSDVGIANLPVKLVGAVPGFLSESNGPTHQAIEDVAIMRGIPKMQVFCPASYAEMVAGMESAFADPNPCYIRFNSRPAVVEHSAFEWGKAEVFSPDAADVSLLVYGTLFPEALEAQKLLLAAGIAARLVNLRTIVPLDEKAVMEAAHGTRLMVTIEDHFLTGGLFSVLSETLVRNRVQANVLPVALDGTWFRPSSLANVLEFEGFTGSKIAEKVSASFKQLV
jgi:transketolase